MRAILVTAFLLSSSMAQAGDFVLDLAGQGAEGRPPYRGGGSVRLTDAEVAAQVIHYRGDDLPLPLRVRYEVLKTAPVLLTTRLGSEHWKLYGFESERLMTLYTDEKIDMAQPGPATAQSARAWFDRRDPSRPTPGLAGIRGRHYFLIDQPNRKWLDVVDPPPFFDQPEIVRKLTFTLADLGKYAVAVGPIESTWKAGGPLRVKLTVTDATGKVYPVVNAPAAIEASGRQTPLATEWGPMSTPTGWMCCRLPDPVPERIRVKATVTAQTPRGLETRPVEAVFARGAGQVSPAAARAAQSGYQFPRDAQGTIRETRAIWTHTNDIPDAEQVDRLVERCRQGRLNVLIPCIFVRNGFTAGRGDLMPTAVKDPRGFDPLAVLIGRARAAGLEVHPWFCVTYRDQKFRDWFRAKHGVAIDMLDRHGNTISLGADVHRPEYADFIVKLMVGVARDYPVDGIHLDYIRTMDRCYCGKCAAEFAARFGKPLAAASNAEWIAWQREAIGQIVRRTAEGVRAARPGAVMSAAVFADMAGGAAQGQDSAAWARKGWVDVVLPMDYAMQPLAVRANERQFLAALADGAPLASGLCLYSRSGAKVSSRAAEVVREQIEMVRGMGIHGYCLFAYSHLDDAQVKMLAEVNRAPAVPYYRSTAGKPAR